VHADVLRYCKAELLQENYFHAVFEATKSIAAKIRDLSGLASDGAELAQSAFGLPKDGTPPVRQVSSSRAIRHRVLQSGRHSDISQRITVYSLARNRHVPV
jgi:uncharacterized protein (TIGR02391 family)